MSLNIQQTSLFDYASLDAETRVFVQEKAQNIHARLKRTAEDVIAIGQDLMEVKERLKHGQFESWLQSEFQMGRVTAHNFIRVATRFGDKYSKIEYLPVSALYELAAPSTPEAIIEQVEAGQIPATLPAIREAKRELQQSIHQMEPVTVTPTIQQPSIRSYPAYYEDESFEPTESINEEEDYEIDYHKSLPAQPLLNREVELEQWQKDNIELGLNEWADLSSAPPALVRDEPEPQKEVALLPIRGVPAALLSSESNEWYTPSQYVEAARELMGGIDVDPASNAFANEKVQAATYYDIETNGLNQQWIGRVWLNPPYGRDGGDSNQEIWTRQLIEQFAFGFVTEAVLLVNANTEAKWFQPLYSHPICFTDHRIRFYTREGVPTQPTQGNAFIYFGSNIEKFAEIFSQFGPVVRRIA